VQYRCEGVTEAVGSRGLRGTRGWSQLVPAGHSCSWKPHGKPQSCSQPEEPLAVLLVGIPAYSCKKTNTLLSFDICNKILSRDP